MSEYARNPSKFPDISCYYTWWTVATMAFLILIKYVWNIQVENSVSRAIFANMVVVNILSSFMLWLGSIPGNQERIMMSNVFLHVLPGAIAFYLIRHTKRNSLRTIILYLLGFQLCYAFYIQIVFGDFKRVFCTSYGISTQSIPIWVFSFHTLVIFVDFIL